MNTTFLREGMRPCEEYARLAEYTGFFRPVEIEILREVVLDYQKAPDKDYSFFEETRDGKLAGFVIFGRTPLTDFSWDIYWIAVAGDMQGRGVGRRLVQRTEETILKNNKKAVIRIETSGKEQYEATQIFYRKTGFTQAGTIPDFYSDGDDLLNYYKTINR